MAESAGFSMKLLIDTQKERVLFAEAGKDCIDFFFHTLSLPMAAVIRLLNKQGLKGSLANLYESVEYLNESYIQQHQKKDILLKPAYPAPYATSLPFLKNTTTPKQLYTCSNSSCGCLYVSDDTCALCPKCKKTMNLEVTCVTPPAPAADHKSTEGGFVKGVVTYMVMDDLCIMPMSTISAIALLNKFSVKDVGMLKEKVVKVGKDEAVKLLKACLHSKKVLTEVFLGK